MHANFAMIARRFDLGDDWLWGAREDCSVFKDQIYISKAAKLGENVDLFHRVALQVRPLERLHLHHGPFGCHPRVVEERLVALL